MAGSSTPNPSSGTEPSAPGPQQRSDPGGSRHLESSGRWAPWWLYLAVLLGANYLRSGLMPVGTVPEPVVAAIALAQAAILFVAVTTLWRLRRT